MNNLISTSGLTNTNTLTSILSTDSSAKVHWYNFATKEPLDDIDSLFAEFEGNSEFQEGVKEASSWLAEALYPESLTIAKLRLLKGLSQTDFAVALEMKQPQVARLEKGDSNPNLKTLVKLAETLDVSLDVIAEALGHKVHRNG